MVFTTPRSPTNDFIVNILPDMAEHAKSGVQQSTNSGPRMASSSANTNDHLLPPLQPADPVLPQLLSPTDTGNEIQEPDRDHQAQLDSQLQSTTASSTASTSTRTPLPEFHSAARKPNSFLYLAYGSNLAASTFQGSRKIRPLSAVNVIVPTLKLTFDLPGMPYTEPCFANTNHRDPAHPKSDDPEWQHGLVGVVYEVTPEDYAHIINTEGGGASYKDVLVKCWPIAKGLADVPDIGDIKAEAFEAHTLLAPPEARRMPGKNYEGAEPSPRYKGLLTTGAAEHDLPKTYQAYLNNMEAYRITSWKQTVGKYTILVLFFPWIMFLFSLSSLYGNDKGKIPGWLGRLMTALFAAVWQFYLWVLKPVCGNGERTQHKHDSNNSNGEASTDKIARDDVRTPDEETPLLEKS